jgi:hypothetical protein
MEILDDDGFPMDTQYEWLGGIPANFTDLTRDDEILANQMGYSADQNIEIMACNYSGESFLVDEATGEEYDIKRTFQKNKSGTVTLTCRKRERGR